MIKKILMAVMLIFPMMAAAQTLKVGVVNTNDIIAALPETTQAQTKLQEVQNKYQQDYEKLSAEVKKIYDELNNMKEDELPAIKQLKVREFQDQQQKMQMFEQQIAQDLQKQQDELLSPIIAKVKNAVESVGKENGFSLIQDYNPQLTLYYASPVEDITPLVKAKLGVK